jgi:HEAT repeat protein
MCHFSRTMRIRVLLMLLAIGVPGVAVAAPYDVNGIKLDVSATPEKAEILLGETCRVFFKVANQSKRNLGILVGGDYRNRLGRPISFKVEVIGADGRKVPEPDPGGNMGGMMGPQKLPAGGEYVFTLFLNHWATFEKPGRYTIKIRRTLKLVEDDQEDWFRNHDKVDVSVTTTIAVVAPDAEKLGKVIAELGTKSLDNNSDVAETAQKMLAVIHDERVIPYYLALAQKPNLSARYAACRSLGQYQNDEAFEALLKLAKTTGIELRETATTLELAESSAEGIRRAAIHAIGDSPDPKALPYFWACAKDPHYAVRLTVLHKAAKLKSPEARAVIATLTADPNETVRNEAIRYQKQLAHEDANPGAAERDAIAQRDPAIVSLRHDATDEDLAQLSDDNRITILRLSGMDGEAAGPYVTDAGLVHLAPMTQLKELWLDGIPLTDAGMVHLRGLTRLRVLRFYGAPLTDAGLANFQDMKELENLQLGHALITDEGMPIIGGLKKLQTLDLRTKVTDAGLVHLEGLSELRWLCLTGTSVGDVGLASVGKLSKLEWLMLEGTKVTDAGLQNLKGLTRLNTLYLTQTSIGDAGLDFVAELKELERLKLNKTQVTDEGLLKLRGLAKLRDLEVHQSKVTQQGILRLKKSLPDVNVIMHQN